MFFFKKQMAKVILRKRLSYFNYGFSASAQMFIPRGRLNVFYNRTAGTLVK